VTSFFFQSRDDIVAWPARDLPQRIEDMGNLSEFADQLDPSCAILGIFPMQPDTKNVHIIVKAPAIGGGKWE
jgi:hypothetical protein